MKRSEFRQIIREEIRNLYLAEAASEKDALELSKMVEKAFRSRKFYKTKTSKNKDNVTVDIMFRREFGDKSNVKFMFYPTKNDGNGEVTLSSDEWDLSRGAGLPARAGLTDYLFNKHPRIGFDKQATFDVFKKTAPAILKHWSKQAIKDGVVEPL